MRPLRLRDGGGLRGPDVKARKRLYQPERAPIRPPIASDWRSKTHAYVSSSETAVPPVDPLAVPFEVELGAGVALDTAGALDTAVADASGVSVAAGADAVPAPGEGVAPGVTLGAGVDVSMAVDASVADALATWLADATGDGVARPAASVSFTPLTPIARTNVIEERRAAITPASQVALGAKKPAIIGVISGG